PKTFMSLTPNRTSTNRTLSIFVLIFSYQNGEVDKMVKRIMLIYSKKYPFT
ncbi:MAG: hypothetical protein ACI9NY_001938, partial [Kiritimatiellia bacterium]